MAERKNQGKLALATLVPLGALEGIARAAEVGLVKYKKDSFREHDGYTLSQCLDSAVRHIFKLTGGEEFDPEASALLGKPVSHLDMAAWNLSAALESRRLYGDEVVNDLWKGPTHKVELPAEPPRHLQECGTQFRGCAPNCPFDAVHGADSQPSR